MTSRSTRGLALALALCAASVGIAPVLRAEDPWYELYQDALKSIQSRKWAEAERRLKASMTSGPRPGRQVRMYGVRTIDYLPDYQLGLVYFNERKYADALEQLTKVQASGLVNQGDPEFEPLKDMLQLCRIRTGAPADDKGDASLAVIARDMMKRGNLVEAHRILESARQRYPQSAPVLEALLDLARLEEEKKRSTPTPAPAPPPATTLPSTPTTTLPPMPPPPTPAPATVPAALDSRGAFEAFYSGRYGEAATAFAVLARVAPGPQRGRFLAYQAASLTGAALLEGAEGRSGLAEARRVFIQAGRPGASALARDSFVSPAVLGALKP